MGYGQTKSYFPVGKKVLKRGRLLMEIVLKGESAAHVYKHEIICFIMHFADSLCNGE